MLSTSVARHYHGRLSGAANDPECPPCPLLTLKGPSSSPRLMLAMFFIYEDEDAEGSEDGEEEDEDGDVDGIILPVV